MYVCTYNYVYVYKLCNVCMYVCMYVCTYVCTYVRTYVCMYVCMYKYWTFQCCIHILLYIKTSVSGNAIEFCVFSLQGVVAQVIQY